MARYLIIVILFIVSPWNAFSQEEKVHVNIKTGISIPLGKFSSSTLDGGSFAQLGWSVDLEGTWFFFHGLGVGLQAGYHTHTVDVASLATEKVKENPFLEDLVIRSDPYRVVTLAGFVQYYLKISKQFSFIPSAGVGAALGFSPYQLYKPVYFLVTPKWYEITSTWDWSPYYLVGGNFHYHLSDCFNLFVGTEFGYTILTYRFLTGTGEIREDTHKVMFIDVLAGITLKF